MTDTSSSPQESLDLLGKINGRVARVGVIGMGYVGLPTMVAVAECGFKVTGIDIDEVRVAQVNEGHSYIEDVSDKTLHDFTCAGKIWATTSYAAIEDLDVILVCVPTPITEHKEPDLKPMTEAIDALAKHGPSGQLVVLQSTTYPGTTEGFVLPRLEETGREVGQDFYLAFALERVDPGNDRFGVRNVPKVVAGVTPQCTQMATAFLSGFVDQIIPVSSPKVAEMSKLLENTFRSVNIALVNELAMLCRRMGIDVWEVIEAASTKPFGFMPFYPGPGVGGHCIPVDPFYLAWKAKEHDFYVNFIQLAAEINDNMPYYTLSRIAEALGERGKALKGARILVLGVAFKENINDTRNSPALRVMELLSEKGATVSYNDHYIPNLESGGLSLESVDLESGSYSQSDAVVILASHSYFNWAEIVDHAALVIDTRNATHHLGPRPNVVKL